MAAGSCKKQGQGGNRGQITQASCAVVKTLAFQMERLWRVWSFLFFFNFLSWKILIIYTQNNMMSPRVRIIQLQQLSLWEDFEQRSDETCRDLT